MCVCASECSSSKSIIERWYRTINETGVSDEIPIRPSEVTGAAFALF